MASKWRGACGVGSVATRDVASSCTFARRMICRQFASH
jgi:hypothetical protein